MKSLWCLVLLAVYNGIAHGYETIYVSSDCWGDNNGITNKEPTLIALKNALLKYNITIKEVNDLGQIDSGILLLYNVPPEIYAFLARRHAIRCVAFLWEPPTTYKSNYDQRALNLCHRVFTWDDSLIDQKKYIKLFYAQSNLKMIHDPIPFEHKKLCTFINGNKFSLHPQELYSARKKAVCFFEQHHPTEFDFYGTNWHKSEHPCYHGEIGNKIDVLKRYKFCICYENMHSVQGYITEKIFDCFVAGCVPIYWGASNITDYIPEECFIDRRQFETDTELYNFLKTVTQEQYATYLDNIRNFLASPQAEYFSIPYFVNSVLDTLGLFSQKRIQENTSAELTPECIKQLHHRGAFLKRIKHSKKMA